MKRVTILFLLFLAISVSAQPLIIAHRGAISQAPENTMAAFKKAIELGADALELDLRQTKDGQLVVIHDASINRTTNGEGDIGDILFDDLRKLDAGGWFEQKFSGEKIPTLQEVINLTGDSIIVIIELKGGNETYAGIEEKVITIIRENKIEQQSILKSFDPNVLERLRKLAPDTPQCYVYALRLPWLGMIIDTGITFGSIFDMDVEYLQPHRFFLSESFVEKAQNKGYKVIAWGVNSESAILEAIEFGVDGIETDYVDRLLRLLHK